MSVKKVSSTTPISEPVLVNKDTFWKILNAQNVMNLVQLVMGSLTTVFLVKMHWLLPPMDHAYVRMVNISILLTRFAKIVMKIASHAQVTEKNTVFIVKTHNSKWKGQPKDVVVLKANIMMLPQTNVEVRGI